MRKVRREHLALALAFLAALPCWRVLGVARRCAMAQELAEQLFR